MLSRKFIKIWLILLTIAAVALLIDSCASKIDGPQVINNSPKVEIVNIPPNNSHFTTNPQIFWFGTDVDGKIVTYEYAVVPAALLAASHVDTSSSVAILAYADSNIRRPSAGRDCQPESCWQQIDVETADNPNEQTIRLYADKDPKVSILQYFFVRAVDNDSARSKVDYRLYSRTNHPPETVIRTVPDTLGYFDLPDTSASYKGVLFEWKGTDKIDYPDDNQDPTFEYFYQVFGPYEQKDIYGADGKFDYTKVDTIKAVRENKLVLQSYDSLTGSNWVKKNTARIFGLWKGHSDTTRAGHFVLKVTARDDAFVPDTTPAYVSFFTIDAKFENDLLVYVPCFCDVIANYGIIPCGDKSDSMLAFYRRVISSAGYDTTKMLVTPGYPDANNRPSKLELAKYKVYLLIDDGGRSHLTEAHFNEMTPYLDMGGKVWLWALSPFGAYYSPGSAELKSVGSASKPIPRIYFDVVGEWYGGWGDSYKKRRTKFLECPDPDTCPPLPKTNEEFLGGLVLDANSTGLPSFGVDSMKYSSTYTGFPDLVAEFRAAPYTNFFSKAGFSEPLWTFHSYFGDYVPDSMQAYVAGLNGRVIAVRNRPASSVGKYKTAVYGFSMYVTPEDQADSIFAQTMRWFLEER